MKIELFINLFYNTLVQTLARKQSLWLFLAVYVLISITSALLPILKVKNTTRIQNIFTVASGVFHHRKKYFELMEEKELLRCLVDFFTRWSVLTLHIVSDSPWK